MKEMKEIIEESKSIYFLIKTHYLVKDENEKETAEKVIKNYMKLNPNLRDTLLPTFEELAGTFVYI